jgi:Protein of unknown function (DUF2786)
MDEREKIVDRIEKLMRRTRENGASESEVETAMKLVQKLMDEHNVEMAEVMAKKGQQLNASDIIEESIRTRCKIFKHEEYLFMVCCEICEVKGYYRDKFNEKKRKYDKEFVAYGVGSDVRAAHILMVELLITVMALCRAKMGPGWNGPQQRYCDGFGYGLLMKVLKEKQDRQPITTSNCTTMIVRKKELIRQHGEKLNLRQRRNRGEKLSRYADSDFQRGMNDGREYEVNADRTEHVGRDTRGRLE